MQESDIKKMAQENKDKALLSALEQNNLIDAELLLKNGANPEATNPSAINSAFMWSIIDGEFNIFELLLKYGANPNACESDTGESALYWAVTQGHFEIAKTLLENGANPNTDTKCGANPLFCAASGNNVKMTELLLEHQADPNIIDFLGFGNPLPKICKHKNEIFELLLKYGLIIPEDKNIHLQDTDVLNMTQEEKDKSLFKEVVEHNLDNIKLLLKYGANPNKVWGDDKSPILELMTHSDIKTFKLLLQLRDNSDAILGGDEPSILYEPLDSNENDRHIIFEMTKTLLEFEANPNSCASIGSNPLFNAARLQQYDLVKLLFQHKADPNLIYNDEKLIYNDEKLIYNDEKLIYEKLIDGKGSSVFYKIINYVKNFDTTETIFIRSFPNAIDKDNTLIDYLDNKYNESIKILELFFQNGADANLLDEDRKSVLENALDGTWDKNLLNLFFKYCSFNYSNFDIPAKHNHKSTLFSLEKLYKNLSFTITEKVVTPTSAIPKIPQTSDITIKFGTQLSKMTLPETITVSDLILHESKLNDFEQYGAFDVDFNYLGHWHY